MTAVCGELPSSLISRFAGGDRYKELVVLSLKKDKLLTTFSNDHLRGYRLGRRAKSLLLESQPERFSFFLSGRSDTNHIKSETARRARLHRVAASTLRALNSGSRVFRDEKPPVFSPSGNSLFATFDLADTPAFYSSREVKEMGIDATRIRGSRMTGVLLAPSAAYLIYQGGVQMPELDHKAEQRARSFLLHVLCGRRFAGRYGADSLRTILSCDDMQVLVEILQGSQTPDRKFFPLEASYNNFYYLTNDHHGDVLLGLLCDPDRQAAFNQVLLSELRAPPHGLPVGYDAVDKAGRPVLFAHLPDIPRLGRFLTPDYRESSGVGKRPVLTPDEVLRLPLDEAIIMIRGKKVLRVDKFDYSEHPEARYLRSEKASAHIPEWRKQENETAARPRTELPIQPPAPKPAKRPARTKSTGRKTKQTQPFEEAAQTTFLPDTELPSENGIVPVGKESILTTNT